MINQTLCSFVKKNVSYTYFCHKQKHIFNERKSFSQDKIKWNPLKVAFKIVTIIKVIFCESLHFLIKMFEKQYIQSLTTLLENIPKYELKNSGKNENVLWLFHTDPNHLFWFFIATRTPLVYFGFNLLWHWQIWNWRKSAILFSLFTFKS